MGITCKSCGCHITYKDQKPFCRKPTGEYPCISTLGQDRDGVTENFHNHIDYIKKKGIKLNFSDMFFREAFGPMHLMNITQFNCLIDDFIEWYNFEYLQVYEWESETDDDIIDVELVPFECFMMFMSNSKYFKTFMKDEDCPMKQVLTFTQIFVRKKNRFTGGAGAGD